MIQKLKEKIENIIFIIQLPILAISIYCMLNQDYRGKNK